MEITQEELDAAILCGFRLGINLVCHIQESKVPTDEVLTEYLNQLANKELVLGRTGGEFRARLKDETPEKTEELVQKVNRDRAELAQQILRALPKSAERGKEKWLS